MTVDVTVNGRAWKVAIEPHPEQPGQVEVIVDGVRRTIDLSWIDGETLSMIDAGTVREIRLHRRGDGAVGVEIGGTMYEAAVQKRFRDPFPAHDAKTVPGSVLVKANMPGRVARVLVAVGDRVAARQGVVVVEAMKMENELRAPRAGTVTEIKVAPGAAVEAGTPLLVIGD
jgi:biotin carboxyl carrier protein